MSSNWSLQSAIIFSGLVALLVVRPAPLRAQGMGYMAQGAAPLTDEQQSAANSALCSIISKQTQNPASASPSILSDRTVLSAAAPIFANSVHLPLPDASSMLQGYVMQHAGDVLASCAAASQAKEQTSKTSGEITQTPAPNNP